MKIYIIFLLLLIQLNCSRFLGRTSQLSRVLRTVYLLPHSHDDVGWLDTVEEIYQRSPGVKNIITSYVNALLANSKRRFVQVEIYYFKKWWDEQSSSMKQKVKRLVENKQLDFACGAWTMNDEATAYYEDIIDQLSDGHKFLFQEFNITVKIGWQIDPFGHSATQSKINYLMGMDAQFFTRIDYQDKRKRKNEKSLEMIITHQQYKMFTHVNFRHYSSPPGFDFDPFNYNHQSAIMDQQVPRKANTLAQYFTEQFDHYKGNVIAHTLGDDNEWSTAEDYFQNIEKVMDYINQRPDDFGIIIRFATPQEFIRSLNEQQIPYPTKQDDFFPYADKAHCYWTGYFTSKPSFKGLIKQTGRQYQQMRNFLSIQLMHNNSYVHNNKQIVIDSFLKLSQAMGIHQHHDAVTGTAKQFVTTDYMRILITALNETQKVLHETVNVVLKNILGEEIDTFYQHNWNASINNSRIYSSIVAGKTILLTILDTKFKPIKQMIKLKMPNLPLVIIDQENKEINGDLICSNLVDVNDCNLFFIDDNQYRFQQLHFYKIKVTTPDKSSIKIISPTELTNITAESDISLDDGPKFKLTYNYYNSSQDYVQPSGAYIFRPENNTSANYGEITKVIVFNGTLLTELLINRTYCVSRIRKNKYQKMEYEVETHLGSIPNTNSKGREIILVVDTNIKNDQLFYTDSNGLELQKRKLNYRETWDLDSTEPISENYYPITAIIMIEDRNTKSRMAILNDRAQGGSSLKEGQIEIMIHRRMYRDDKRGVGESLNEHELNLDCANSVLQNCDFRIPLTQKMIHKLVFFDDNSQNVVRQIQLLIDMSPILIYSISSSDKFNLNAKSLDANSNLINKIQLLDQNSGEIVDQVKVYSIPWDYDRQYLIRIQNFQEIGVIRIVWPYDCKVKETTISGLQEISEWNQQKLNWKSIIDDTDSQYQSPDQLNPLQIKTYLVTI